MDPQETAERLLLALAMLFCDEYGGFNLSGQQVQDAFFKAMHSSPYCGEGF